MNEGSAGATIPCPCGLTLSVPSLSTLRVQAGLPPYDPGPVMLIQHLLSTGRLPGTKLCVVCGHETDQVVKVAAECETSYRTDTGGQSWTMTILGLVFFLWPALLFNIRRREFTESGRDTVLSLPLALCNGCRRMLRGRKMMKKALLKIPLYSQLLQKFPDARLTLETEAK